MSEYRLALVDKTFEQLQVSQEQAPLTVSAVCESFDPAGLRTGVSHSGGRFLSEFVDLFQLHNSLTVTDELTQKRSSKQADIVSREQFIDFYDHVSAVLQVDQEFALVVQKVCRTKRFQQ